MLSRLSGQVDLDRSVGTGQLGPLDPADALSSGQFSTEDMLEYWRTVASATQAAARFSLVGVAGEMPSLLDHPDGCADVFCYEFLLTAALSVLPEVLVCLYDLERFGAEVLMDTLRTHPRVIVDGMIHDNPYYVEPGELVAARG